ncbi:precorrin-2 C(20)-methyltransferase [uncultured Cohaesibacter sp.]|uniref:precorrin-2 C(20)-methyltransferase n=1 Tax=uncultured Cohaesibacter sp. TaxID=1002546 RepID=UPI0029307A0B|nr:precorrin-2 C(20)-methyltransferase [uncultured Cohaesibacter sp.]
MKTDHLGRLYGVGVGPGDPELLTLKAARLIASARIIAYPAPQGGESFARQIVKDHISPEAREITIEIPMRPERAAAQPAYDKGAEDIRKQLEAGEDVVVLCEGDPFFYGSFMYLFERLQADFEAEVIPGVNSVSACASRLQQPLTGRNDVLTVLPGSMDDDAMTARLNMGGAFAIMKFGRHLPRIRALLKKLDLIDKAGYVERATLSNERVLPLKELGEDAVPYFSMILIYDGEETWKK